MPTMVTDVHDHFTEVFGTKRGAVRPEDDVPVGIEDEALVPQIIPDITGVCPSGCSLPLSARKLLSFAYIDGSPSVFYCPRCRVPTNAVGADQSTVASPAQSARTKERFAELQRAEEGQRRREMKAEKRRWHKCFFSRPLGHAYPSTKLLLSTTGGTCVCTTCGKTHR